MRRPRFSLLIPVRNGMPYLATLFRTVTEIENPDVEIIVSDDHSVDGSFEFVSSMDDSRLKVISQSDELSMSEHWNQILSHASGEWMMFLGQDDGVHLGFWDIAQTLTTIAESRGIRSIATRRSYYFWPGIEDYYGSVRARYLASGAISVLKTRKELRSALLSEFDYFELPQMYTTSLFHHSLVEEGQRLLGGNLIVGHPQDAYLSAVACLLDEEYLRAEIPIGWVGSSPSSAGLAITHVGRAESDFAGQRLQALARDYSQKIQESKIKYSESGGEFSLGIPSVYLLSATLELGRILEGVRPPFAIPPLKELLVRAWLSIPKSMQTASRKESFDRLLDLHGVPLRDFQRSVYFRLCWWSTYRGVIRAVRSLSLLFEGGSKISRLKFIRWKAGVDSGPTMVEVSRVAYEQFSARWLRSR